VKSLRTLVGHHSAVIGIAVLGVLAVAAVVGPIISPHDPEKLALDQAMLGPSASHWLGTDDLGRDLLTRLMAGGRISLLIGVGAVGLGLLIGGTVGIVSGYAGGKVDLVIQRVNDAMFAFSSLLLALALVAILGPGVTNVIVSVGIATIPVFVRLGRAQALVIRGLPFVQTAELMGVGRPRILSRHVLRNALTPLVVQATVVLGAAILAAAGLGFLGLGVQEPQAEWGAMLGAGRQFIFADSRLILVPGVAIFLAVIAFNLLGDGLRDALDPRLAVK
jgi:peptide/nickel transport system permease protein